MVPSPMGDYVYTPLRQKDGPVVLFNRGWAPRSAGPGNRRLNVPVRIPPNGYLRSSVHRPVIHSFSRCDIQTKLRATDC